MLYTIIDIETTGMGHNSDEILEVGYMQINKKLEIVRGESFYFYKPEFQVEKWPANGVHKLKREFLEKFEGDFDDNLVKLFTLLHNGIILGKNSNAFDIPFIQAFIRRHAFQLYPVEPYGVLDLQDYYKPKFREYWVKKTGVATNKSGTLGELIEMIGYSQDQIRFMFNRQFKNETRAEAHGALYDVYMTYLLVDYAVKNYGMKI